MAIIDVIKYDGPEDGSNWLVHKVDSERFVLGSQLIVNSSQEALFFKGGKDLDLFTGGTHTLKTGNLPILNKLVNLPFGGNTPFAAEVYYINKTAFLGMGWGTGTPFDFEDPRYKVPVQVGIYGEYDMIIPDSRLFVRKLIGAIPGGNWADPTLIPKLFNGYVNSALKPLVAGYMEENEISFLSITAHTAKIADVAEKGIREEFERYGVEILKFKIETIKPIDTPELAEAKKLETKRNQEEKDLEMQMRQFEKNRDFYAQRRSFDVMDTTAANPGAGGVAAAGMGLGMGMGALANMGQAFGGMTSNMNVQPAPAPAPAAAPQVAGTPCAKCGVSNPPGMKFCGGCGNKL